MAKCEDCEEFKVHLKSEGKKGTSNEIESERGGEDRLDPDKRKTGVTKKARRSSNKDGNRVDENKNCGNENCSLCEKFHLLKISYHQAREAYHKDRHMAETRPMNKECVSSIYLSADMPKVILLPRLPEFKRCLFTKRIVVINQSFVPIARKSEYPPIGIIWHEGISGRKDDEVTSAFFKLLNLSRLEIYLTGCFGFIIVLAKTNIGPGTLC